MIFDGDGNQVLFNLMAANYNYFEGITIRNTNVAFLLGIKNIAGSIIASVRRAGDIAARYGGEEFAILFPGASAQEACQALERLRGWPHEDLGYAMLDQVTLEKPGHLLIHYRHDLVEHLNNFDGQTPGLKILGHFQPDVSCTDHESAPGIFFADEFNAVHQAKRVEIMLNLGALLRQQI